MSHRIDVTLDHPLGDGLSDDLIAELARAALAAAAAPDGAVGIVVTDDETVRDLNRTYRGEDTATDVLSFGLGGFAKPLEDEPFAGFVLPQEAEPEIGEVVIAYPYAERQAAARDRRVRDEVALLVVHGVLHLLGHDHAEADEEAAMQACERAVLARFGIER